MTRARDNSFNPFNNQVAGKNAVINGAFDFWQRGVSINGSANGTYTADRWSTGRSGSALTVTRQTTSDTTNLPTIQYCARVQRDSGNTSTGPGYIIQPIESSNSIPFAGKTVTLSFYARKGADYSTTNSWLNPSLWSGTGIDQNPWSGYTNTANIINSNVVLTTAWQRYSLTSTIGSTATELLVQFGFSPIGTAGANDYFEITGVQLELGSVSTSFSRAGGTIAGEFAACQRYYETNYPNGLAPGYNMVNSGLDFGTMALSAKTAVGGTNGANRSRSQERPFAVQKRSSPSIQFWDWIGNASKYSGGNADGSITNNNLSVDQYGGVIQSDRAISFQTVSGSSTIAYSSVMWAASAEL